MTFEELSDELNKLVSEKVAYRRIAANSIIIYFFGEPGDESVVSVFIDPTWHYQQHGKVVLGSRDLQIEEEDFNSKEEYQEEFQRLCSLADVLEGATLEHVEVDFQSSDISMTFSDGQVLRNFANSAFDDKAWTHRNKPRGLTVYVSPLGIKLVDKKTEQS